MRLLALGAVSLLGLDFFSQVVLAENGTVGLGFAQLYDDGVPNQRGALIVALVAPNSAGAEAGIQLGDLVTKVNGQDVSGHALQEVLSKQIHGPVGEPVRLSILRGGSQTLELSAVRRPYALQHSAETDPFSYTAPGDWRLERAEFPLPWAPALRHRGLEELFFAPDFDDPASKQYHTFAFFLWMAEKLPEPAASLQSELREYFLGVSKERATSHKFAFDPSQVKITVEQHGAPGEYLAELNIYDTRGQVIAMHAEISRLFDQGHSVLFLCLSPQDRNSPIWEPLRAIRDSFHYKRNG